MGKSLKILWKATKSENLTSASVFLTNLLNMMNKEHIKRGG